MRRARIVLFSLLALGLLALAVDRAALFVWRRQIIHYHARLARSSERLSKAHSRYVESSLISWSGDRDIWQVPLLEVAFGGPSPTSVTVDGNGGLNFLYAPPLLAWSRHVPWAFRRPIIQGSDTYAYNDVYIIRINTLESRPSGKVLPMPTVELQHGLPF